MKNILIITITLFTLLSCKAQNPVVNIDASRSNTPDGAYFKDLNNEFDKFTGTWIYSSGSTIFTIELKKVEMIFNGKDYQDKLVGEYKYIVNGLEVINTLPNINNTNTAKHAISGRRIINNNQSIVCDDCGTGERRVELYFDDPERIYLNSSIILRYLLNETSPEKLQVTIYAYDSSSRPSSDSPTTPRVPYDTYILEKL